MKSTFLLATLATLLCVSLPAFAGAPSIMTFQTKIISPSGTALEAASVNFRFTILDSAGTCILYVEDYANVNMTGSQGIVAIPLGSGTKQYPPAAVSLYEVFNNATASFNCQAGGTSSPTATDNRQVVMQFNDGGGWQTLPQMAINAVPFANYATRAESLGAYVAADYLRPATLPTCTAGQALNWDGTAFTCITPAGGGGGAYTGVTSITNASGDITLAPAAGTGAVLITSNTPSTSTSTGAIVITGGVGVSGAINTGGNITTLGSVSSAGSMLAVTSIFTPQLYGTSTASGDIRVDGTSNATKGNVLLASQGGNVGIGVTTTPSKSLHIQKTLGAGVEDALIVLDSNNGGGGSGPSIAFKNSNTNAGYMGSIALTDVAATGDGRMEFRIPNDGTATLSSPASSDTRMVLTKDGDIGLGQTSPTAKIHVMSNVAGKVLLDIYDGPRTAGAQVNSPSANLVHFTALTGDSLALGTNDSEKVRITTSGNVGIGTTTPTYALSVSGDVNVTGNFRVNGAVVNGITPSLSGITNISNASGDITLAPAVGTGAVQINSGSASTSPTTGALIVSGGIGASGAIYTGGAISSGSSISATTSMYTPQLYGTSTASGNIYIDGTSHPTVGNVILTAVGGNVGIGPTAPGAKLDVMRGAGIDLLLGGNNGAGAARTNSTTKTAAISTVHYTSATQAPISLIGAYNQATANEVRIGGGVSAQTAATQIEFFTAGNATTLAGTERMRLDYNGRFGIGTTTPASYLSVSGDTTITGAVSLATTSGSVGVGTTSPASTFSVTGNSTVAGNSTVTGTTVLATTSGLVGIGTTSPTALLSVGPNPVAVFNSSELFQLGKTGDAYMTISDGTGRLLIGTTLGTPFIGTQNASDFTLRSNNVERVRIDSNGWVGIGTTNPQALLDILSTTNTTGLLVRRNSGIVGNYSSIGFRPSAAAGGAMAEMRVIRTDAPSSTDNAMAFFNMRSAAVTESMRIDGYGNVGIGTSTPQARLDLTDSSTTTSAVIVPRAATFTGTAVNGMVRYNTDSTLFEFYQNGGWVNYTTVSDGRLKNNIVPVTNGLDIVNQLNPVFYDWDRTNPKTSGFADKHQVGFIAQEVEKVLPEVVNKGEDSYRSLEYGKIVSVVVAAVKELYAKVTGVESELASVKAENAAKDQKIKELEQRLEKIEKSLQTKE